MKEASVYMRPNGQLVAVCYQDDWSIAMQYTVDGKKFKNATLGFIMSITTTCIYLGEL